MLDYLEISISKTVGRSSLAFSGRRITERRSAQPVVHGVLAGHGGDAAEQRGGGAHGPRTPRRRRAAPPARALLAREPRVGPHDRARVPRRRQRTPELLQRSGVVLLEDDEAGRVRDVEHADVEARRAEGDGGGRRRQRRSRDVARHRRRARLVRRLLLHQRGQSARRVHRRRFIFYHVLQINR